MLKVFVLRIKGACLKSTGTRDTCIGGTYVTVAYIEGVCIRDTCIAGPYARGFRVGNACICAVNTCIGAWGTDSMDIYIRSAYIDSIIAIKRSGIHSQSFQNFEVGGAGLEI